jgi:formiminotetrahydrofolate cyclodeaminase
VHDPIAARTIGTYLETLASSAPTPGGGSVAGVIGALGCSLGKMVIVLTGCDSEDNAAALRTVDQTLSELQVHFTELAEKDEAAYQGYRDAAAMPRSSAEEKSQRRAQMQIALKNAASVPLETARSALTLAELLVPVQKLGNPHLHSDTRIALLCGTVCFESSRINVDVNLAMIRDETFVAEMLGLVQDLAERFNDTIGIQSGSTMK